LAATPSRWCVPTFPEDVPYLSAEPSDTLFQYLTPMRARVTGATSTTPYPAPRVARKCVGAPKICVKGPKNPHYWMQNEKNNAPNPDFDPPYVRLPFRP
jgi:hypothetical protein